MKTGCKIVLWGALFLGVISFTVHYILTHDIPVLNPKGLIALQQKELIILSVLIMCIVVIPVFFMLLFFSWRYRDGNKKAKYAPNWGHNYLAEAIWWGLPIIISVFLGIITWRSTHQLSPYKPIENGNKPLLIQAVALEWKWLFIYPEQGVATVNYIQFPENTPLVFEITADAPMNSFWIPQLGGQIYAMPGMRTELHLIANETGTFRGTSSNLSGSGFAGMVFKAVSSTEERFDSWIDSVKESPYHLSDEEYHHLALPSEYDPVSYYSVAEAGLFNRIIKKYSRSATIR